MMKITVPAQDPETLDRLPDITKEVVRGCGVTVRIPGTRYQSFGKVIEEIDDDHVRVRGVGFEAIVNTAAIVDCQPPDAADYQLLVDKNINGKDLDPGVDTPWQ